ncbi:uncharacterized protein BX663DRAFT_509594 [Cokeromyces recurvatus]|uniref:uncharacterized protein n=1 Tax=Cokeromyces recurvatus TaxID=90255 RepID=UPI0022202B62|nr:uncharacterized protein BX663DRAFT_509594 [Cokeromyces recurvatus]KAI7903111.1 hypothetical protein BX663DRAFT_509594 [Cokeromyces recurvatus]
MLTILVNVRILDINKIPFYFYPFFFFFFIFCQQKGKKMSGTHTPQHEIRDPIMEDDHFSLRFGNPIQVIHNIKKHEIDTFEPTKNHVSGALASTIGDALHDKRPTLKPNHSSFLRDSTICSEFYHDKKGGVKEIEHTEEETSINKN